MIDVNQMILILFGFSAITYLGKICNYLKTKKPLVIISIIKCKLKCLCSFLSIVYYIQNLTLIIL